MLFDLGLSQWDATTQMSELPTSGSGSSGGDEWGFGLLGDPWATNVQPPDIQGEDASSSGPEAIR